MRLPWDNALRSHEHTGHVPVSVQFHVPGSNREQQQEMTCEYGLGNFWSWWSVSYCYQIFRRKIKYSLVRLFPLLCHCEVFIYTRSSGKLVYNYNSHCLSLGTGHVPGALCAQPQILVGTHFNILISKYGDMLGNLTKLTQVRVSGLKIKLGLCG